MQAPHPDGPAVHRGYSHPGLEKVSQYAGGKEEVGEQLREVADCKESYEIGSEWNREQRNVWLPETTLPGFKQATSHFYWKCNEAAQSILQALALGIGLEDSSHLTDTTLGITTSFAFYTIRLLRLLIWKARKWQDPHQAGKFVPATLMEGACVMNVGGLLMRWSNGGLFKRLPDLGHC
jgi:isopenicillin N synthase-like dioxygenase